MSVLLFIEAILSPSFSTATEMEAGGGRRRREGAYEAGEAEGEERALVRRECGVILSEATDRGAIA